ncbi:hypothetical protein FHL15_006813 [Xylaria flabelliformis]|uniref:Mid2 domain-containing protein n=1 Tax=Xylaria flabelliformis TaxID=2512241 RepID=A0A553HW81_9PEZI|nr:hypothetical protein FHL15_006813 [Xylaria flabelliformis]
MSRFLTTATVVTAVRALAFDGRPARATDVVIPDPTFNFPAITQAPNIELFKRAAGDQTVLIAPDNTCGYVSGRPGAAVTCNNDYTCAFIIQEDFGRAGCCQGDNCGLRATCLDYNQVYSQSACDNGCLQDTFTLKCTETTASFCNTETFYSGIIDFYCNSYNISTPQQLYTTYSGETGAKTWQQFIITPTASGTGNTGLNSATDDGSFGLSITSKAAPSNTQTSSGGSGNNGSSGDNSGNNNNNNPPTQKQSSTPIAPIVGGVVGGVGGLALIGLAIWLIIRHNNKKKNAAAAATPGQPMQQTAAAGGGMSPPPNGGAAGYPPTNQGYNGAYGQPPYQQQTPPPQAYYPTGEQKPTGFVGLTPTGVPDRHDSTSPVSQMSDPRYSTQPHSPTTTLNSNWGPQTGHPGQPGSPNVPQTVYEAGGNVVGERDYNSNHRGQFHEMA